MSGFFKTFLVFMATILLSFLSQPSINRGASGRQPSEASTELPGNAVQFDCFPEGYKSSDVVSYRAKRKGVDVNLTVEEKLNELKAHCEGAKLVDSKGREIRFFKLACYGNPPSDYEELRQRELEELEKLQKKYCVIVMECDPRVS